jgi:hypothetical protein
MGELLNNSAKWSKISAGEATGEWKVEANQLKIYSGIDSSLLATFNLFDKDGIPSSFDVMHRKPI